MTRPMKMSAIRGAQTKCDEVYKLYSKEYFVKRNEEVCRFHKSYRIRNSEEGFIALISVLMVSVILLAAVISLAQYGITSRFALLRIEHKTETLTRAQACVEVARIAVVNDPGFETTNKNVAIGDAVCMLEEVFAGTPSSGFSRVEASATLLGATTNVRVEINTSTGAIVRSEEVPDF